MAVQQLVTFVLIDTNVLKTDHGKKLHNDELHSLFSSPNILRVIKSRRMRGRDMCHAWRRGEAFAGFWLGGPKGRDRWKILSVGGRIKLRRTLGRYGSMGRIGFGCLWIESSGGLLLVR
jgi:hypothetical protein